MPKPNRRSPSPPSTAALRRLRKARGFVFDMDGTLVLGDKTNHGQSPLQGAIELTSWLVEKGLPFVLFTNGTAQAPEQYVEKMRKIGFRLPDNSVMTPASSAADLFSRRGYRRILALGGDGMTKPLADLGIEIVPPVGEPTVDAVLIGWYREFDMSALESACYAAWNGAHVFSCSQSLFFATAQGKALGTSRAIAAMIRDLTGCRIHVIGKPSLEALRCAGRHLNVPLRELAVVGDDPSLEVPMAHRGKSLAIAVHSGLGEADSFDHLPKSQRPHITVHDVAELLALYKGLE